CSGYCPSVFRPATGFGLRFLFPIPISDYVIRPSTLCPCSDSASCFLISVFLSISVLLLFFCFLVQPGLIPVSLLPIFAYCPGLSHLDSTFFLLDPRTTPSPLRHSPPHPTSPELTAQVWTRSCSTQVCPLTPPI